MQSEWTEETLFYATEEEIKAVCDLKEISYIEMKEKWEKLPIHKKEEIKLDIPFLCKNNYPITQIKADILPKILKRELPNEEEIIKNYIIENYN